MAMQMTLETQLGATIIDDGQVGRQAEAAVRHGATHLPSPRERDIGIIVAFREFGPRSRVTSSLSENERKAAA